MSKSTLQLAFFGNQEDGSSTLIGKLLILLGCVNERVLMNFERPEKQLSWLCNEWNSMKGMISRNTDRMIWHWLESRNFQLVCIKVQSFTNLEVRDLALCEIGVIVLSAQVGHFENALSRFSSFRKRLTNMAALHCRALIVCVNKMDLVEWDEARFNEIEKEINLITKRMGVKTHVVPISALDGTNVLEVSTSWFKGSSLLDILDNEMQSCHDLLEYPLRVAIIKTIMVKNQKVFIVKILTGVLTVGMMLQLPMGSGKEQPFKVLTMERNRQRISKAIATEIVAVTLNAPFKIRSGTILSDPTHQPAEIMMEFDANVVFSARTSLPLESSSVYISNGFTRVLCHWTKIFGLVDKNGNIIRENIDNVQRGEIILMR